MVEFAGYEHVEPLAEGGLGRLYKATRISTGGTVAIKELREVQFASDVMHRARRELGALLKLKGHPYVVSVEEIIEGPNGPCIVMEFAPGGSLYDRVLQRPLDGPELVLAGQHVVSALSAAHEVGIIHRDVKPHNLLVGSFGQVKVCDFGIAALYLGPSGRTQTQALTLAYASPEELDGDQEVGPPADVYSFGATWVHLMTGKRPTFKDRLSGSSLDISLPTGAVEPGLRSMLLALRASLAHDPADRPTMDDLRQVFDDSAVALGPRRLHRFGDQPAQAPEPTPVAPLVVLPMPATPTPPSVDSDVEQTIKRPLLAPPGIQVPPIAPAVPTTTAERDASDSATVIRPKRVDDVEAQKTRKGVRGPLLVGALVSVLVVAAIAVWVVVGRGGSDGGGLACAASEQSDPACRYFVLLSTELSARNELMAKAFPPGSAIELSEAYRTVCTEGGMIESRYHKDLKELEKSLPSNSIEIEQQLTAQAELIAALQDCALLARADSTGKELEMAYVAAVEQTSLAFEAGSAARRLFRIDCNGQLRFGSVGGEGLSTDPAPADGEAGVGLLGHQPRTAIPTIPLVECVQRSSDEQA